MRDASGEKIPPELKKLLKPGKKLRLYIDPGNPNNKDFEVRGIVDDMIVTRRWAERKKCWEYRIDDPYRYRLDFESGWLSLASKSRKAAS